MPTFILTLNWTEQGIRAVKDAPKRSQAKPQRNSPGNSGSSSSRSI
jgi:uncharacterized protein with GYD domain